MSDVLRKIEWMHFRLCDESGILSPKGGVTVCYLPEGDKAAIGSAVCSVRDTYCKKVGRQASAGRAKATRQAKITDLLTRDELASAAVDLARNAFMATGNCRKAGTMTLRLASHRR